ncbi:MULTISPECIES: HAD family hydrolase [Pseudonocardia]|uniref:6-phosphogluconate phosphatase n=2 Tax=Pseudonocardia TaxID=1847 RepID=A0A1Y2MJP7_PSEAH|nr:MULTISPECIES: HAD family hydrolase [Pseudonocardia]OSY35470.1 6-phosphogluconate phosphatase [Pseudonocardia autotrophica]TDN76945.1 phosphoglycolate phosphatase-like HAD superfamily hydrolase [Pseudonocardia autotrophica]BBG00949.1 haloacid dehalogenase [Pseudonocardia autotrophica]GEC29174.1 haloacid dehalogenase [Pseudonocardia saturnea]
MTTPDTAVIDVDGTLVDTNYHHTIAWSRALRRFDRAVPLWRLHRAVGMGGDQLVPAVAGDRFEAEHGDDARAAWKEEFEPLLPEVRPLAGARELLTDLSEGFGLTVVLASSGAPEHVEAYLELFDGRSLARECLTGDDVTRTKPDRELFRVAVRRVAGSAAFVVGDSVWDVRAAVAAGYPAYAVRTGGFGDDELREAGAREIHSSLDELRQVIPRVLRG